jgi:hypothetical protein
MFTPMDLGSIRSRWNEVLDALEAKNRIAWIAYFDARLSEFNGNTLTLDFSDSRKFASPHEYFETRPNLKSDLISTIYEVLGVSVEIIER